MNDLIQIKQIDRESVDYLMKNLDDLGKDKAVRSGLKATGNVFESAGKSRLKKRMKSGSKGVTGNLLKSFKVRLKRKKLGVLIGFKQGIGGGSHAHLVDKGTDRRYWKTRNRKSVGVVVGNRFWTDTKTEDFPKAMNSLYLGIEKYVNKISNRQ